MFLCKDSFAEWKIPKSGKKADVRLSEPESGWISNDSVIHSMCLGREREEVGMLYDVNVQMFLFDRWRVEEEEAGRRGER